MKTTYVLFFITIFLLGCSNDDNGNTPDTAQQLIGNWVWVQSTGGIAGVTNTPESTGNNRRIEITSTLVSNFLNGELQSESAYAITTEESMILEGTYEMLVYENDFKQSIVLNGNVLFLYDECNDCFMNEYRRE